MSSGPHSTLNLPSALLLGPLEPAEPGSPLESSVLMAASQSMAAVRASWWMKGAKTVVCTDVRSSLHTHSSGTSLG